MAQFWRDFPIVYWLFGSNPWFIAKVQTLWYATFKLTPQFPSGWSWCPRGWKRHWFSHWEEPSRFHQSPTTCKLSLSWNSYALASSLDRRKRLKSYNFPRSEPDYIWLHLMLLHVLWCPLMSNVLIFELSNLIAFIYASYHHSWWPESQTGQSVFDVDLKKTSNAMRDRWNVGR